MILLLKDITLKKDTMNNIKNGIIDVNKYIEYIQEHLSYASYLEETKLQSLDEQSLYEGLSKVFDIELDDNDLLEIMKEKYNKHYTDIMQLKTTMVDNAGNNIALIGISTKGIANNKKVILLKELRRIVNSYDFIIIQTLKNKLQKPIKNPENYEDYQFINVSKEFDDTDGLFAYKIKLLRNKLKNPSTLEYILKKVRQYKRELMYQAKNITKYSQKEVADEYRGELYNKKRKKRVFRKGKHRRKY